MMQELRVQKSMTAYTHKPKLETKIMRNKTLHGWGPQSFGLSPGVRHRSLEVWTNEATHVRFMIRPLTSLARRNKQLRGWIIRKTEWTEMTATHKSQGKECASGVHVSVKFASLHGCSLLFHTDHLGELGFLLMSASWRVCSEVWETSQQ